MQVVLLERVEKLGAMGAVVTVKPGYARNYLIPRGRALRATEANIKHFEERRAHFEAENLRKRGTATEKAEAMKEASVTLIRQASESGHLYGSVTAKDIAEALSAAYVPVDRNEVIIHRPIKDVGVHKAIYRPHPELSVEVTVSVARTQEEADKLREGASPVMAPLDQVSETDLGA